MEGPRSGTRFGVILGLETSCDETAAALVTDDGRLLANVVSSQAELHARYGGVVPEVASRHHLELLLPAVRRALDDSGAALDDVGRIAVTQGPGLIGALLVGVSAAKALAWARRAAARPGQPSARPRRLPLPGCGRSVRHSSWPRGTCSAAVPLPGSRAVATRSCSMSARPRDLRGARDRRSTTRAEAFFHKGARLLGPRLTRAARRNRQARRRTATPKRSRSRSHESPGSGLLLLGTEDGAPLHRSRPGRRGGRAAARRPRRVLPAGDRPRPRRADAGGGRGDSAERIAVVGGVAANSELRAALPDAAQAPLELCTDNAAMIASAARFVEPIAYPRYLALDAFP